MNVESRYDPLVNDPREMPVYKVAEAARLLRMNSSTLLSWIREGEYDADREAPSGLPLISVPIPAKTYLSFFNLLEAHVIKAIRSQRVTMRATRDSLEYLRKQFPSMHPLLDKEFETDGISLFCPSPWRVDIGF